MLWNSMVREEGVHILASCPVEQQEYRIARWPLFSCCILMKCYMTSAQDQHDFRVDAILALVAQLHVKHTIALP